MDAPSPPATFRDTLRLWPTFADAASDLSIPYERVAQWAKRDSVPAEYWPALVNAARTRGFPVDLELLAALAARQREPSNAA